jgi:hypothetical protein
MTNPSPPIAIKKYANRRLCNAPSGGGVTLADLAEMAKTGRDFVVADAKTNQDIARSVLIEIVAEQGRRQGETRSTRGAGKPAKNALIGLWDDACGAKNCSGSAKNGLSCLRLSPRRA